MLLGVGRNKVFLDLGKDVGGCARRPRDLSDLLVRIRWVGGWFGWVRQRDEKQGGEHKQAGKPKSSLVHIVTLLINGLCARLFDIDQWCTIHFHIVVVWCGVVWCCH